MKLSKKAKDELKKLEAKEVGIQAKAEELVGIGKTKADIEQKKFDIQYSELERMQQDIKAFELAYNQSKNEGELNIAISAQSVNNEEPVMLDLDLSTSNIGQAQGLNVFRNLIYVNAISAGRELVTAQMNLLKQQNMQQHATYVIKKREEAKAAAES